MRTHTQSASEKHVEKARVLFEYVAEEADELSVKDGDIVEVVTKDAQEGWWEVREGGDGRRGRDGGRGEEGERDGGRGRGREG